MYDVSNIWLQEQMDVSLYRPNACADIASVQAICRYTYKYRVVRVFVLWIRYTTYYTTLYNSLIAPLRRGL
jgi:hypothetical protein